MHKKNLEVFFILAVFFKINEICEIAKKTEGNVDYFMIIAKKTEDLMK
jgi:hypothetical protein